MVSLATACKIKRIALGYTQETFGNLVGVTGNTISNFEAGKQVSESIMKCIKYTLRDEADKLTGDELAAYKLRVACEMAIYETDEKLRHEKLRTVCFSALKWSDIMDKKSKGFIEY